MWCLSLVGPFRFRPFCTCVTQAKIRQTIIRRIIDQGQTYHVENTMVKPNGDVIVAHVFYSKV